MGLGALISNLQEIPSTIMGTVASGLPSSTSHSFNSPVGATNVDSQMSTIMWSIAGGLPGVGGVASGTAWFFDQDTDVKITVGTMLGSSLALWYFAPGTAAAVGEAMQYGFLRVMGLHPERAWPSFPAWMFVMIALGVYKYVPPGQAWSPSKGWHETSPDQRKKIGIGAQ